MPENNAQPNVITVTGKTGNNQALTAQVFRNVGSMNFNYRAQTLTIDGVVIELDTIATVTYTISGGTATVTIST